MILTATLGPKLNARAFKAGADAILKSVSADRLLNRVPFVLATDRAGEAIGPSLDRRHPRL